MLLRLGIPENVPDEWEVLLLLWSLLKIPEFVVILVFYSRVPKSHFFLFKEMFAHLKDVIMVVLELLKH